MYEFPGVHRYLHTDRYLTLRLLVPLLPLHGVLRSLQNPTLPVLKGAGRVSLETKSSVFTEGRKAPTLEAISTDDVPKFE